jgi:hypothetical protein
MEIDKSFFENILRSKWLWLFGPFIFAYVVVVIYLFFKTGNWVGAYFLSDFLPIFFLIGMTPSFPVIVTMMVKGRIVTKKSIYIRIAYVLINIAVVAYVSEIFTHFICC